MPSPVVAEHATTEYFRPPAMLRTPAPSHKQSNALMRASRLPQTSQCAHARAVTATKRQGAGTKAHARCDIETSRNLRHAQRVLLVLLVRENHKHAVL